MKRKGVVTGLLVLFLAVGCRLNAHPSEERSRTTATAWLTPTAGAVSQHLVTAIVSDPKTFNPIVHSDESSATVVGNLFDTLVRLDPHTMEIEPALATEWQYNGDGTECIMRLRDGVRWHDGEPFTTRDVVFTLRAIQDKRVPSSLARLLDVDGKPIEVATIDASSLRIRLPHSFAPLLSALTAVPIIPEHVLAASLEAGDFAHQWGIGTPPEKLIGTGPYRMTEFVAGSHVHYRRNPDYWRRDAQGRRLPYLEERTIRIVADENTLYREFLAGRTHIHNARPEEVPELLRRQEELGIRVQEIGLETGALFLTFNRNPRVYEKDGRRDPRLNWFTDKHFLRAIAHSIDRQAIIEECMHGLGEAALTYISPENKLFYHPNLQPYPYDFERARALLAEGGYQDRDGNGVIEDRQGHEVSFRLNTNKGNQVRERMCSMLQANWIRLGMAVQCQPLDFAVIVDKLERTFDWDAMLVGFTGVLEPHNGANLVGSKGDMHLWNPNQLEPATAWEAEIDALLEQGARELDVEKRRRSYLRIQEILNEELPMIQMVRQKRFVAFTRTLENFAPTAWGLYRPELIRFADQFQTRTWQKH